MIVKGTITLLNINPFCLYTNPQGWAEVGIAEGYFAGDKFAETEGDEYITEISGRSFGWFDSVGNYFKNDKQHFTRPTNKQIIDACLQFDSLSEMAVGKGLIEITREEVPSTAQTDCITNICLN